MGWPVRELHHAGPSFGIVLRYSRRSALPSQSTGHSFDPSTAHQKALTEIAGLNPEDGHRDLGAASTRHRHEILSVLRAADFEAIIA
jgi:hypothetical protein